MFLNSEPAWHRLGLGLVLDGTLPAREAFRPGDLVNQYLVGCTSHDGTVAFSVFFSPIRVVCQNTLSAALGLASQANALISACFLALRLGEGAAAPAAKAPDC